MYRALKSFSGVVSMVKGECREIENKEAVADLLKAGYIVDMNPARAAESSETTKAPRKNSKKAVQ